MVSSNQTLLSTDNCIIAFLWVLTENGRVSLVINQNSTNKMCEKPYTIETVPKFNRKIVEIKRQNRTGTSIKKRDGLNLVCPNIPLTN